jgi:hypothetical protein
MANHPKARHNTPKEIHLAATTLSNPNASAKAKSLAAGILADIPRKPSTPSKTSKS